MNEIRITKFQAAQRQIDAGIWMLFRNDDPVAIHTVAMAAFRILRDLVKKRGLEDPVDSMIRPGKKKAFWCAVGSFPNFLKHADKGPDDISGSFLKKPTMWCCLLPLDTMTFLAVSRPKRCRPLRLGT